MSTKLTCTSILPSSILTPSTIQCTKFYSDAPTTSLPFSFYHNNSSRRRSSSASNDMKRYLTNRSFTSDDVVLKTNNSSKRHHRNGIVKSATMPIISSSSAASSSSSLKKQQQPPTPINLINRSASTFICLDNHLAKNIQQWLPTRISVSSKWSLVYSLDQHGASLNTLYNRTAQIKGPCLLVIQDNNDEIFGAYLSEGIRIDSSCYGTGECFLWKQNKKSKMILVYPWTMLNDYLIYSNGDFFAVGGGQGKFGLWLHSDLTHGYTESCATFNNPVLSQAGPAFECLALEIWDFQF